MSSGDMVRPPSSPMYPQAIRLMLLLPQVSAQPLGVVSIGRVLRAQRLPERNLATAPSVAYHSLVLGTVQVRHHPRTHQQVGLHIGLYKRATWSNNIK